MEIPIQYDSRAYEQNNCIGNDQKSHAMVVNQETGVSEMQTDQRRWNSIFFDQKNARWSSIFKEVLCTEARIWFEDNGV